MLKISVWKMKITYQTSLITQIQLIYTIIQTELKRTKYNINNYYDNYQFDAIYYNGWKPNSLNQYINLLIGGARKKMLVLIDGNSIKYNFMKKILKSYTTLNSCS
jgi:hypothetical protein